MALALLPLLLALGYRGERPTYLVKLVTLWGSFCIAIIATFVIKKIYTSAFLGDSESFIATLLHRTYGGLNENMDAHYSATFVATTYYRASALVGLGSSRIGASLVLMSLAIIAIMTWRRARSRCDLLVPACWLALLAIGLWYAVFPEPCDPACLLHGAAVDRAHHRGRRSDCGSGAVMAHENR